MGDTLSNLSTLAGILAEVSRETSKSFDAGSFNSRLRIQKTVYLLGIMGVPEAREYRFSYYVRGPYSPSLAKAYYALDAGSVVPSKVRISEYCMNVVRECVGRGDAFLEAVSTLHSIASIRRSEDKKLIIDMARSMKPQLSHKYDDAWQYLLETGLI